MPNNKEIEYSNTYNTLPISRRQVLQLFLASLGPSLVTACLPNSNPGRSSGSTTSPEQINPNLTPTSEQYAAPELVRIGTEILNWRLFNGVKMGDIFSDVQQTGLILTGRTDPRNKLPFMRLPIRFSNQTNEEGHLLFATSEVPSGDPTSVFLNLPSGRESIHPWFGRDTVPVTLSLSPTTLNSTYRWPTVVKEMAQVLDIFDYAKVYVALVQQMGVKLRIDNPKGITMTQQELVLNYAFALNTHEQTVNNHTFWGDIVDYGTIFRNGTLLHANWMQDQINQGRPLGKDRLAEQTNQVLAHLSRRKLVEQRNNMIVWTDGRPPAIDSPIFLELFRAISGRTMPVFKD